MQPELDVGPLTLQTFGIMFALGFVAAGALVGKRLKELGKPTDWAYEMIFAALVGGIVGARIDFVMQNYDSVSGDLFGNIFSGSGLVWFGGAVGGAAGVLLWARWRRMLNPTLLDVCAPGLAIGYAVGRIGCQVSGDGDYGIPWDGPWAMAYPDGTVATDVPVHPGGFATRCSPGCCSPFTSSSPDPSASWSSSSAATTRSCSGSPRRS
jgi:phosphatidylglycerol---prolipoprotein diacylglyceryl transferase